MIQGMLITSQDVAYAKKKLLTLHKTFENPYEREAAIDFENCLRKRLKSGTAVDFLVACEKASDDLLNPEKVPETYNQFTAGQFKGMTNIFAKELFGPRFAQEVQVAQEVQLAREVQDFIKSKELV